MVWCRRGKNASCYVLYALLFKGYLHFSGFWGIRLSCFSLNEELKYHVIGQAILTNEDFLEPPLDELEELLEPAPHLREYLCTALHMPLHPITEPPFTYKGVGLSFLEFLLLLVLIPSTQSSCHTTTFPSYDADIIIASSW